MQMERVTFRTKNASVLHHKLHACVERKNHNLRSVAYHGVVWWGASIIEWVQGAGWEIRGVDPLGLPREVGLKKCSGWECERYIVHRCCKHCSIRSLTSLVVRAGIGAEAYCEEKVLINFLGNVSWKSGTGKTTEFVGELCRKRSVIKCWESRFKKWKLFQWSNFIMSIRWDFIFQDTSNSCVVKSSKASGIWSSSH
ncbi:hypothetical protein KIW84_034545 [Lathyrus oleraceus]|uniref:Uncharacterized protein n=1 Tax=Pisum sativum TaxID=3888 RepID=A0A9D4Y190_PEA|nr:hypothetical protein KIW84_034545 [Pisum sativum]